MLSQSINDDLTHIYNYSGITRRENTFYDPTRFYIMLFLYQNEEIVFSNLQKILGVTAGNLDYHIKKLSEKEYVISQKVIARRLLTIVRITPRGLKAFKEHVNELKSILHSI